MWGEEYKEVCLHHAKELRSLKKCAVMWNVEDSDVLDMRNFCPAFITRIAKTQFEVIDDYDDICFASLDLEGDDGLANLWGTYIKPPTDEFVDYCKEHRLFSSGAHSRHNDKYLHKVSPKRKAAHDKAAENMEKAARNVIKRVKSKNMRIIGIGDVVQIPLVPQDRAKLDLHHLTGVVVQVNEYYGTEAMVCSSQAKKGTKIGKQCRTDGA